MAVGGAPVTPVRKDGSEAPAGTVADPLSVSATIGLPTGAATSANQTSANTKLDQLHADLVAATPAGENHIGKVGGESAVAGGTITRPADTTAYASGDLVAASTTAATVNGSPTSFAAARVNAGTGLIRRVRLSTSKTGLAGTEVFRVHFFKTAPTVANGDNGAFSVNGVAAIYIGHADVTLDRVYSDGAKGIAAPAAGSEIVFEAGAGTTSLYWLLEARGAYTPASGETFTMAAEILRD